MNIAIVTCVYNGYGEFVDQWLGFIDKSFIRPEKVVIALGRDHGLKDHEALFKKYERLNLQFHFCETTKPLMGLMRNQAVGQVESEEWVMYLSVDDMLLPDAIGTFESVQSEADYICISWESIATWKPWAPVVYHEAKTPMRLAREFDTRGFIVGHSPWRKKFWDMEPYMNHDYPNAPFVAGMIKNGARFVSTDVPCTRYLQRQDSHAARLGRRGKKLAVEKERQQARKWKQYLQSTMRDYYT